MAQPFRKDLSEKMGRSLPWKNDHGRGVVMSRSQDIGDHLHQIMSRRNQ
jgi:hypothetical protein